MQNNPNKQKKETENDLAEADRRQFLSAVGKFSIATPPAITLLLSTSLTSPAIAMSGGRGDDGWSSRGRGEEGWERGERGRSDHWGSQRWW